MRFVNVHHVGLLYNGIASVQRASKPFWRVDWCTAMNSTSSCVSSYDSTRVLSVGGWSEYSLLRFLIPRL